MGAKNLEQQKIDRIVFQLQKLRICHQHIFGRGRFSSVTTATAAMCNSNFDILFKYKNKFNFPSY